MGAIQAHIRQFQTRNKLRCTNTLLAKSSLKQFETNLHGKNMIFTLTSSSAQTESICGLIFLFWYISSKSWMALETNSGDFSK